MTQEFEQAYAALNPEQRAAVDAVEGPVMVIAGPGTGKTQILTLRIANILKKTQASADAILALTFTESAAANMRRRLVEFIGTTGYYVHIHTFHGFCNRLIERYPEYFPGIVGAASATEADRIGLVREILETGEYKELTPFGDHFHYVSAILASITKLKREDWSPARFEARLRKDREEFGLIPDIYHEKGAHKGKMKSHHRDQLAALVRNEDLCRIYEAYEEGLKQKRLYDFEDMLLEVIRAFAAHEDFLLTVEEQYQYVLVDEHQDTNGAQNRILELLMSFHENPNLFVVGDEKQAIFRFQGASLENFLYFEKKYPSVRVVNLGLNYRSTQPILDSAQSLIDKNKVTLKVPLSAVRTESAPPPIEVVSFAFPEAELFYLAEKIRERLNAGAAPAGIAVLFRENREAGPIADFLSRCGIPFIVESDEDILRDPDIQKILLLLRAIERFGDDVLLAEALHLDFWKINPLDIYKLVRAREESKRSLYDLLAQAHELSGLALQDPAALRRSYDILANLARRKKNMPFLEFFENVIRESGFLADLGTFGKTEKLHALWRAAEQLVGRKGEYSLADFLKELDMLKEHKVPIRAKSLHHPRAVRLMTAHKAKGLEFDTVYVVGAVDGTWGNRRNRDTFTPPFGTSFDPSILERNEDERRLFYMALTRARREIVITYALSGPSGRAQVPSQFIGEIAPECMHAQSGAAAEEAWSRDRAVLFAPRRAAAPVLADLEFVRELFERRGLSATALNAYRKCPWTYFYNYLVRLPVAQSKFQIYGNSVHAALQDLFEAHRTKEAADADYLLARFKLHLARYPLREADRQATLRQAENILPAYYKARLPGWNWNVQTEFRVTGLLDDVKLRGNLDKVELTNGSAEVVVVDYKTKAPRSRAWIEGQTKNSTGDYKRQLVFYKLLLELHPEKKLHLRAGVIDFIEPNERGIFKEERFEITDAEVAELKEEILRTAREIRELAFWNTRCEDKKCGACTLREYQ